MELKLSTSPQRSRAKMAQPKEMRRQKRKVKVESKGWRLELGVVLSGGGLAKRVQVQTLTKKPHPSETSGGQSKDPRQNQVQRSKGQDGVVGNQDEG